MGAVKNYIKKNIYQLQMFFSVYPALYIPLYKLLGKHRHLLVGEKTEIVIEGFPRSGNTFSVVAFELAQSQQIKIAHHLHSASQILWAIKHKIPSVVLIRHPSDAVASFLIREPHINIELALDIYIDFYRTILPYKGDILVAKFDDIITDYGKIIVRINSKFDKNYELFLHTKDNVEKAFDLVHKYGLEETKKTILDENKVARPSEARKRESKVLCKKLSEPKYASRLNQAIFIYNEFLTDSSGRDLEF